MVNLILILTPRDLQRYLGKISIGGGYLFIFDQIFLILSNKFDEKLNF